MVCFSSERRRPSSARGWQQAGERRPHRPVSGTKRCGRGPTFRASSSPPWRVNGCKRASGGPTWLAASPSSAGAGLAGGRWWQPAAPPTSSARRRLQARGRRPHAPRSRPPRVGGGAMRHGSDPHGRTAVAARESVLEAQAQTQLPATVTAVRGSSSTAIVAGLKL